MYVKRKKDQVRSVHVAGASLLLSSASSGTNEHVEVRRVGTSYETHAIHAFDFTIARGRSLDTSPEDVLRGKIW